MLSGVKALHWIDYLTYKRGRPSLAAGLCHGLRRHTGMPYEGDGHGSRGSPVWLVSETRLPHEGIPSST